VTIFCLMVAFPFTTQAKIWGKSVKLSVTMAKLIGLTWMTLWYYWISPPWKPPVVYKKTKS